MNERINITAPSDMLKLMSKCLIPQNRIKILAIAYPKMNK